MRRLTSYGPSLIVLCTTIVVLFAGPAAVRTLTYAHTRAEIIQASQRLRANPVLDGINQAYRDIALKVEPSVVHVSVEQIIEDAFGRRSTLSTGSGWIYDDHGHVVTNHHVVENAARIQVQLDSGELREAQFVGADPFTDIAVLKVPSERLHPAERAEPSSAAIQRGDLVFAFGSPFDFRFSMSSGIVSGMGRSVGVIRDRFGRRTGYENFIQVDAAINPGNSGGPLTDYQGRVIGMNTAIATSSSRRDPYDPGQFSGIGLAIPIDMIVPVVSQIIDTGVVQKGYLGVSDFSVRADDRRRREQLEQRLRLSGHNGSGVLIAGVEPGSPAEEAGVQPHDIVTHVDGTPINTWEQLRSTISSTLPGQIVELAVLRFASDSDELREHHLSVELDRFNMLRNLGVVPADQDREGIPELGLARMATSTPALADRLGVAHHPGVMIEAVVPGHPLAQQVEPGTTIVSVMDAPVRDVDEFIEALRGHALREPAPGARVAVIRPDGSYDSSVVLRVPVGR